MSARTFLTFSPPAGAPVPVAAPARRDFLTFKTTVASTAPSVPTVGNFLTFTAPVHRTVMSAPQRDLLLMTPGGVPGLRGPAGPPGPASTVAGPVGPPGPAGAGAQGTFLYTQDAPAATWTINHNLGTKPSFVLELASDPTGFVMTDVSYPDLNTAVVEWPSPESGKAYI